MRTLSRDHIVYSLDKTHPPALELEPGETIRVETYDARTGTIRTSADLLDRPSPGGGNPATGPIWVKGAVPGDSLAVTILGIVLAGEGFVAVKARTGLLAHRADRFATRVAPIRDGRVIFSDRVRFPIRPMIGVIGTAPAGDGAATLLPGPHGGNMDNRYVAPRATVHLPVAVPGALLCLGDVHAAMGDGEITMLALEISAEVTVKVDLIKGVLVARPWIETPDAWVTTGDAVDAAEALRIAAEEMTEFLQRRLSLTFEEAYMLMSARGDVQICQICGPGTFPVTARAVFPRI
jgi:amidase